MKRLLIDKPNSKTIFHQNNDGDITIQKIQDLTKVVDDNQALRNMTSSLDRYGDGKIVLRQVPHHLTQKWQKLGWFEPSQQWRILQDPEAQPFKVFGK